VTEYDIAVMMIAGSYVLWGAWLYDSGSDRDTAAGTTDRKLHVAAKPSVGWHYSSCNTSQYFFYV